MFLKHAILYRLCTNKWQQLTSKFDLYQMVKKNPWPILMIYIHYVMTIFIRHLLYIPNTRQLQHYIQLNLHIHSHSLHISLLSYFTWNANLMVSSVFSGEETRDSPMTYSLKSIVPDPFWQKKTWCLKNKVFACMK